MRRAFLMSAWRYCLHNAPSVSLSGPSYPVAPWLLRTTYAFDLAVVLTLRLEQAVRVAGPPGRPAGGHVFAVGFAPLVFGRVLGGMWVVSQPIRLSSGIARASRCDLGSRSHRALPTRLISPARRTVLFGGTRLFSGFSGVCGLTSREDANLATAPLAQSLVSRLSGRWPPRGGAVGTPWWLRRSCHSTQLASQLA